jgi:hypothetical protein
MKTHPAPVVASPFRHRQDEAFLVILRLRVLLRQLVGVRGASANRSQILKSTARVANCLADINVGVSPQRAERLYEAALFACGRTDVALRLLRADGLLTDELDLEATRSLEQLAAVVTARRDELVQAIAGGPDAEEGPSGTDGLSDDSHAVVVSLKAEGDLQPPTTNEQPRDPPYEEPAAAVQ